MNIVRTSFIGFGLAAALGLGATGCSTVEATDENTQAAGITPAGCVEFAGNTHCALGNARLRVSPDDGSLSVSNLRTAGKDGIGISLPQVTSFVPTGTYASSAATSTVIVNASSEGVGVSMVKAANTDRGTLYSATFTGSGQATTYSAIFSRNGREVARVNRIANGDVGIPPVAARGRFWRWIRFHVRIVPAYLAATGDVSGACSWEQTFDPNEPASVKLANGQVIEVDNLELLEDIPVGGSYPYTSFDHVEYTADNGLFTLNGEEID